MIRFENVSLSYGGAAAVRDLNFTVGRGEFVALVGANGAGKTTVSKLMNGLLKPTAGRVLVDGVPTTSLRTSALAKKIGFLFQNPDRQLCKPTIREEIRFGLALTGAKDAVQRTEAVLEAFGLDGDRDPFSASRGERQRIALASLLSVTQMSDLSGVLVQRLHVPYKYAFTLTTATRFIPVFADSLSGIMEAQTARGVAFDTKNPFRKLGLILPLCMPLLISSVGRIHDTAAAAEMRGFTLRTRESQSRRYTFKSGDLFAALIAAALVAAGALL